VSRLGDTALNRAYSVDIKDQQTSLAAPERMVGAIGAEADGVSRMSAARPAWALEKRVSW
jgi:hypothetical protein